MYKFELKDGELIHIGGIPYRHVGDGVVEGGTDPKLAREVFEQEAQETPDTSAGALA